MPRKKPAPARNETPRRAGAASIKARGLVPVTVPVPREVHVLLADAALFEASRRPGDRPSVAFWAARVLEEAARTALAEKNQEGT